MVAHGIKRLSRLAGNIRFAFLQRDESRLVSERKKIKDTFQRSESTPAELHFALQALLQKAERMAGSLLHTPQGAAPGTAKPASAAPDAAVQKAAPPEADATAQAGGVDGACADAGVASASTPATTTDGACAASDSTSGTTDTPAAAGASTAGAAQAQPDAGDGAAPALPRARSNQIRQTLRKGMMGLAPAAPLHLQIELGHAFAEAEPDIMAMAARVHALHRQVLGSLKGIVWHSAVHSTLSFDDGRTLDVHFGETGAQDIPEEFRQKQQPAQNAGGQRQGAGNRGKGAPGRQGEGHGKPRNRKPGQGSGVQGHGKAAADGQKPADGTSGAAADATQGSGQERGARQGRSGGQRGQGGPRGQSRRDGGHGKPARGHGQREGQAGGTAGEGRPRGPRQGGEGRPERHGERRHGGRQDGRHEGRHDGRRGPQGGQGSRSSFPGNSAMADKLRAALGNSFGLGSKSGKKQDHADGKQDAGDRKKDDGGQP